MHELRAVASAHQNALRVRGYRMGVGVGHNCSRLESLGAHRRRGVRQLRRPDSVVRTLCKQLMRAAKASSSLQLGPRGVTK